jgi:hypothetical protein
MERARTTVTDAKESYRKNFEITCVGDHISLCFWSGSREIQFVVEMDRDEKVRVQEISQKGKFCKQMLNYLKHIIGSYRWVIPACLCITILYSICVQREIMFAYIAYNGSCYNSFMLF